MNKTINNIIIVLGIILFVFIILNNFSMIETMQFNKSKPTAKELYKLFLMSPNTFKFTEENLSILFPPGYRLGDLSHPNNNITF